MANNEDIHKAVGIVIRDNKLLFERSKGKRVFMAPGGKIESGETAQQALVRELHEEFGLEVHEEDLELFGSYIADAANQPGQQVHMQVFTVTRWRGEPTPKGEVEEIRWLTSDIPKDITIGSIFSHVVVPALKVKGMIH